LYTTFSIWFVALVALGSFSQLQGKQSVEERLANYLLKHSEADANGDGKLTKYEFKRFRLASSQTSTNSRKRKDFPVHQGWEQDRFPPHAVSFKSPAEIMSIYKNGPAGQTHVPESDALSFDQPKQGVMRIVGTGHSFMKPGYVSLTAITRAAGFEQPLCLHTGGGHTGSTRYRWELENGIFNFDGEPLPKLLAAISNADWEAMVWGPYENDRPEFYRCWMDFCEKHNPGMKYYLSDAWPTLMHFQKTFNIKKMPASEDVFTAERFDQVESVIDGHFNDIVSELRKTSSKVYILPTHAAFTAVAKLILKGELAGYDGLYKVIGKKANSIWRDERGHIAADFERLEGYVFYGGLYGRSPELIKKRILFKDENTFKYDELDEVFRKIAWQAVVHHPLSGVEDQNNNGVGDHLE
jgi:hypothetical protein